MSRFLTHCCALGVFAALGIFLVSCQKGNHVELPEQELQLDEFSGEIVEDQQHAAGVILERFVNAPKVGDLAPETRFFDPETVEEVELSALLGGKPVVLVFGSWSCTTTSLYTEEYADLYSRFSDVADFYFVYLREAHPKGGYMPALAYDMAKVKIPEISDPQGLEGRCKLADEFGKKKDLPMRFLVDSMDDMAAILWAAWPARLYVIGGDGRVLYSGGQGPWYYKLTKENWHTPPPIPIEKALNSVPYAKISLEEFLESLPQ
ncbi:MAG: hypothetical protein CMO55_27450 [Verrucomicrobiales bacterium]|nr:hypothetical protein [Verrucomicrobiales bacterium]